jgi:ring-1,2-phenylacetyl-CoA epoxidase subunit PaaD
MKEAILTQEQVWELLSLIQDPELPVISLVDLGVIRSVDLDGDQVTVGLAPTFSGCPALLVMQDAIRECLLHAGFSQVTIQLTYSPPWTSEWITPQGREILKSFGIAPPARHSGLIEVTFGQPVACPYCGSFDTEIKNEFGPTPCRSITYCNHCQQPFELFKSL